jgi:hypothetical protein
MARKKARSESSEKNPSGKKRAEAVKADERTEGVPTVPWVEDRPLPRGLGPEAAGQAGDIMGLPRTELAGPESVEELVEEGQAFEAGILAGVENAPEPERGPIRTREVPEDDVPLEYLDDEGPPGTDPPGRD